MGLITGKLRGKLLRVTHDCWCLFNVYKFELKKELFFVLLFKLHIHSYTS